MYIYIATRARRLQRFLRSRKNGRVGGETMIISKGFALTWCRALTWYSSPARPFAAPDDPRLVTGQQGSPSPACQQLSRARNVCAGGSGEGSTKLKHGTKLGRTLCYRTVGHRRESDSRPAAAAVSAESDKWQGWGLNYDLY